MQHSHLSQSLLSSPYVVGKNYDPPKAELGRADLRRLQMFPDPAAADDLRTRRAHGLASSTEPASQSIPRYDMNSVEADFHVPTEGRRSRTRNRKSHYLQHLRPASPVRCCAGILLSLRSLSLFSHLQPQPHPETAAIRVGNTPPAPICLLFLGIRLIAHRVLYPSNPAQSIQIMTVTCLTQVTFNHMDKL
jgi:hypothetical protein